MYYSTSIYVYTTYNTRTYYVFNNTVVLYIVRVCRFHKPTEEGK